MALNKLASACLVAIMTISVSALVVSNPSFADDQIGLIGGPFPPQQVAVLCASSGMRHAVCDQGGIIISAQLARQDSRSACVEGRSWGYTGTQLWVDHGCRGAFNLLISLTPIPSILVSCASSRYRYAECALPGRAADVQLERQDSASACRKGATFGTLNDRLWVNRGCRGVFRVFMDDVIIIGDDRE